MDMEEVEARTAKARTTALEAKVAALTNMVIFLTTQTAREFDTPGSVIATLAEATRQGAEEYDYDDPDLRPGHIAMTEWADDFEERVREQL